jgi:NADPH2:quinone reductase
MQAIAIDHFGQSAELHDIPVPAPGPGEIQVRMHAAGINPLDWKVAGGMLRAIGAEAKFPLTLGFDGAGTVERIGDGVTRFAVGEEVFGLVWPAVFEHGTFAEYFIASEHAALAAKPAGLSFAQAAALPMPAGTALTALDRLALSPGDSLLVVGATGGVGSYAVQLAKARDIGVIATATTAEQAYMRGLGADELVDYRSNDVAEAVKRSHPDGVDGVLDLVSSAADLERISGVLRPGGRLVTTITPVNADTYTGRGVTATNLFYRAKAEHFTTLGQLATTGALSVPVQRTYPLTDAASALQASQHGHVLGKLVLTN